MSYEKLLQNVHEEHDYIYYLKNNRITIKSLYIHTCIHKLWQKCTKHCRHNDKCRLLLFMLYHTHLISQKRRVIIYIAYSYRI